MKNSIRIRAVFDYKGETYTPSITLDLDMLMERYGELSDFYHLLAKENQIDFYSYQYEVLESCELEFSDATGMACEFQSEGGFDVIGFQRKWHEEGTLDSLRVIARKFLGVENLDHQPDLKSALLAAYEAGSEKH